uniref:DNA polymerase III subunit gamma/tau C-terminal domain-containing protein n=1 Tax=Arsukibacterium sp. TaxID=1977258 RepID=UPI003564E29D
ESIDPLTASIIKRRGLAAETGGLAPKKSEHRPAPVPSRAPQQVSQQHLAAVNKAAGQTKPFTPPDSGPAVEKQTKAHYPDETEPEPEQLYPEDPANQAMLDSLWQQRHQQAEPAKQFDGEINEQNFSVRFAAEVDSWAALVEKMPVGGLMRLFLLNSAMKLEQQQISLQVQQSQQHLDNEEFRSQLQSLLSEAMGQSLQLAIDYSSNVEQCPLAIQQRIEQERLGYVSRLMQQDPNVQQLQQQFDASVLLDTLQVN